MPPLDDEIRSYYDLGEERARLATLNPLEGLRTRELLERLLPPPPATVLDVGGGPGAYAIWLAERRYEVHLVDPVPLHVEQAQAASRAAEQPLASASVGDARELERPDASADAVLLLGPLYHLTDRGHRVRALAEARRVLRPGGVLAAAAISRFASTFGGLFEGVLRDPAFREIARRDTVDGQHRNPTDNPRWFTTAFFHHPAELADEAADAGFADAEVLAVELAGDFLPDLDEWLADPELRETLLDTLRRLEREPTLLGVSSHLLAVGHA